METIRIEVQFTGGTHIARAAGKSASSTAGFEQAVHALMDKLGISRECPTLLREKPSAAEEVWEVDCNPTPASGTKQHTMLTLHLALQIADDTARADVECYARMVDVGDGRHGYDLSQATEISDDPTGDLETAKRAARYIELRGADAFDFRLERLPHRGQVVMFRDPD